MAMLARYALSLVLIMAVTIPADAEPPFRVLTEDASANQLQNGITSTVQVTRSTFSNGTVETILFFSAYDSSGHLIVGGLFQRIDSALFVMNKQGTKATLNHPEVIMSWQATPDYSAVSNTTEVSKVEDNRGFEFSSSYHRRLAEKAVQLSAAVEGIAGGIAFNIERMTIESTEFGSAFLTVRKTSLVQR
jgi:hypothetical protein